MKRLECPKCGSSNLNNIGSTYPRAYECDDCKYLFVEGKQALVDE